jgi:myo-inositol-1(or 4)-monophosphatase
MYDFTLPLQTAIQAATVAGEVLRSMFAAPRQVTYKGPRDIVTDADYAAQKVVIEILEAAFPDYKLVSEEVPQAIDLASSTPTWMIDPLDGTTNYAWKLPMFCVSVALLQGGVTQVGVIHAPMQGETFFAEKGHGAFLRDRQGEIQRIWVSRAENLENAVVGTDWPRDPHLRQGVAGAMARLVAQCRTARVFGSSALALTYVAAGRLDGYYQLVLQPWDVAASSLLIREAGGRLSTPDGGAWTIGRGAIIASNGALHDALLQALAFS